MLSPEYTAADVCAVDQGNMFSLGRLLPEFLNIDFKGVRSLSDSDRHVPGRHDYTTPAQPTADWLAKVSAPSKQAVWFERSSHMIPWEEPGKMLMSLVQDVRPFAEPGAKTPDNTNALARFASCLVIALYAGAAGAFSFEDVAELAQVQARQPYRDASRKAPAELQALSYDQYRDIRFRPDHALWRRDKLPFELMFFHLGKFQNEPVRIDEVTPQGTRHIPYRAGDFDFGKNKLSPQSWGDLGFARLPRALPAECARVQGRGRRVPRRELLSRARRRASATACRRAASRSTPSAARARSFRAFIEFWLVQAAQPMRAR